MKSIMTSLAIVCALSLAAAVNSPARAQRAPRENTTTLIAHAGQIAKTQVESPTTNHQVQVNNRANSISDVDFIAVDTEGNEVARETVEVGPKLSGQFTLRELFPDLVFSSLSTINVQVSTRSAEGDHSASKDKDLITPQAAQLAVAFFSQRDPRWSGDQLGTCPGTTIGSAGCAITAIAMSGARSVTNFNPASLNTYLRNNGGYSSVCDVFWSVAANIDGSGGFTYHDIGSIGSATTLKNLIDGNKFVIAKSTRFSSHWGIIIGYNNLGSNLSDFYYLDPWDTSAVFRSVPSNGWMSTSSATRIFQ
ncbi:MAG TPA: hypothetical protein VHH35_11045 [Pyrinomonadaceae bacterium]|nr:hypothetical protein [Pyrinomonadaceae bacterium]